MGVDGTLDANEDVMTKKTRPSVDAQERRRTLRTLGDLDLKSVCGGNRPGQNWTSSGGGGGTSS
jgi:hypothetical protein